MKLLSSLPFLILSLLAPGQTPKPSPGPAAPGRSGSRLLVVLDLAAALARHLAENGMEVRLTRDSDAFVPLWDRARLANEAGADLFISLHLNAAPTRKAKGSEVFFLTLGSGDREAESIAALENAGGRRQPDPDNVIAGILDDLSQKAYLVDSERLAVAIQGQLNLLGGIRQRGVKQAPFVVLRGAAMPAVLVETAFISNQKEEAKLKDPRFLQKVAQAITRGVRLYFASGAGTPRRRAAAGAR